MKTKKLSSEIIALADYVSLSKENKLTIAGIFDRFFVEKIPVTWPSMFFACVLRGLPLSEHKIRLTIDSENKKNILNMEFAIKIGDNGKVNFISGLNGFPLESYGKYTLSLAESSDIVGQIVFEVIQSPRMQGTPTQKTVN